MRLYKRGTIWWADLRESGQGRVSTGEKDKVKARGVALRMEQGVGSRQMLDAALTKAWNEHYRGMKSAKNVDSQMKRLTAVHGKVLLTSITTPWLKQFTESMKAGGSSNKTINRYLALISRVLKLSCEWGWIDNVPHIPRLKEGEGRIRVITADEYEGIQQALAGHWMASLVDFLLDTGCRLSEALDIPQVDRLSAIQTGKWTIWVNKGNRPRTLPLTDRAKQALKAHQWAEATPKQCQQAWGRVRRALGLEGDPQFVLHALRHTCASRFINAGYPLSDIQVWLGHASVSVTEKYAHLNPKRLEALALCLETVPSDAYHPPAATPGRLQRASGRACILEGFPSGQRDQTVNPNADLQTLPDSSRRTKGLDGKARRYLN